MEKKGLISQKKENVVAGNEINGGNESGDFANAKNGAR
jgi:hypothetical protein